MLLASNNLLVLLLCLLSILDCKSYNTSNSSLRLRRQIRRCSEYEFLCNSGECISDIQVCDGKEDCQDGSDETNCEKIPCPTYAFRCKYGACINKNLVCNGENDCKDNSDETNAKCGETTIPSVTRTCGDLQYRCNTGQCIKEDSVCDGKADCADQSDESQNICSSLHCPQFNFRCSYGACINSRDKCDGKLDCIDGSDEDPTLCNTVSVVTPVVDVTPANVPEGQGCTVPTNPTNGKYYTLDSRVPILSGNKVASGTVVQIKCGDRYRTIANTNYVICLGTQWSQQFPDCIITCTSIKNTESMNASCTYNNSPISCENPVKGTQAKFTCNDFYEDLNNAFNPSRICKDDGTWDNQFPNCIPRCGRKSVDAQALIVGGKKVKKGDYPWQIAVYDKSKNYSNICGGTLISIRTVISAAHCFARNNRGNALNPPSRYKVGAGKYYLSYLDSRDTMAQYSEIKRIVIPDRYTGRTNQYSFDISMVVLEKPLTLSIVVQPICVDWTNGMETEQLTPNSYGVVVGWGLTSSGGRQSDELKELSVPYIPDGECLQNLREDFKPYFTVDKMCSGYLQNGSSACEGDSGGGLVFPSKYNRYYIRGVVSVAPKGPFESCDSDEYTLYTKVSQHIDFISREDSSAKSL